MRKREEKPIMAVTKATFNLPEEDIEALRRSARAHHTTVTSILRRAIATQLFVDQERETGGKLLVEKPDGKIREVVMVGG
jgi:hypothetical protein